MKFISKLSQRERLLFYISVVIVTLFLVDHFIFNQMIVKIKEIDNQIETLKDELTEYKGILSYKEKIIEEKKIYGKYFEKDENPALKLQKTLDTLCIQADLTSPELKLIPSRDTSKYTIELRAEGKMKNLVNFMYNLNIIDSLLKVEKINLVPKAAKSETLTIYIQVSITIIP